MDAENAEPSKRLFSIGHSNQSMEAFLDLLKKHEIEVLVDVRSQPYSKYAGQFNAESLKPAVIEAGIKYLFLGKELGGRPEGQEFYDADGHVLYPRVAESSLFLSGIARLEKGAESYRVAMMCSEENPADCHRHLLIAPVLTQRGVMVEHIRGDGRLQSEAEVVAEREGADKNQMKLFDEPEDVAWRSTRSVSPKRRPPSSSAS